MREKLNKNKLYTCAEIQKLFGGNRTDAIPLVDNRVPYCKFEKKYNLYFPREVWVEKAQMNSKKIESILHSNQPIPIFLKDTPSKKWRFMGFFFGKMDPEQEAKIKKINQRPPRETVVAVLNLLMAHSNPNICEKDTAA